MRDAGLGFGIRESAMRDAERARPCRGRALSLHAPLISPLVLAAWARSQETLGRSTHAWRPAWVTFLRHEAYINLSNHRYRRERFLVCFAVKFAFAFTSPRSMPCLCI